MLQDDTETIDQVERLASELLASANSGQGFIERLRSARISRLLDDPEGLDFILALTDEVLRIRNPKRVARHLVELVHSSSKPAFLGRFDALALGVGTALAPYLPEVVLPLVRRRVRAEFGGVVLPSEERALTRHIARRRRQGIRLNMNVLGEAVLGEDEASRRFDAVLGQLSRNDVDYVSVKISSICSQINVLAFEEEVDRIATRLRELYDVAAQYRPSKFVNLDMEEYRDLGLTFAAFRKVLDEPAYVGLNAGIVLQAYIPDSLIVMKELCEWARSRYERGGGFIKVRIVKGANLAMEQVEAELHGWPQAPFSTKVESDANYKRMLDVALDPANAGAVKVGVASHNLFEVAWALVQRERYNASDRVEIEMLEGMANSTALAVRRVAGKMLLYAPIARRSDNESAIAYLVRRFDENTGPENFLRNQFGLSVGSQAWEMERNRFRESVVGRLEQIPPTYRIQDRNHEQVISSSSDSAFVNEPDTDFSIAANRRWIQGQLQAWRERPMFFVPVIAAGETVTTPAEGVGIDPSDPERPIYEWVQADVATVDAAVEASADAGKLWQSTTLAERKAVLFQVAAALSAARGQLVACMSYDGGKTVAEADTEVSEAVDYARWYALNTDQLVRLESDGISFRPYGTVVVASPWNFPLAIAAGGVLSSLAAGSAVILKPAPETVATGWLFAEACWAGGVPRDVLQFVPCADDDAGRRLITHPGVDAVILTGAWATARMFLGWRPDLRLHAETSGKNALVITAAADLDAAVADLVRSAFGHAGQKCSAASLGIIEASVYDDPRFRRQLSDAVRTLVPGPSWNPRTTMGPLIRPPEGALDAALHGLDPGESWLVEPVQVGNSSYLWSPGVKLGVQPGSSFHLTECFGPVLGLMRAADLDQAIAWQNQTEYGLTAGLHSLDPLEIAKWRDSVEAGNLYVNRSITGAIVRRQPFGGWKRSSFGPGAKAGGPNYVSTLGTWQVAAARSDDPEAFVQSVTRLWNDELCIGIDPSELKAEANVFRYRRLPSVLVRVGPQVSDDDLALVLGAAAAIGVPVQVSSLNSRPKCAVSVIVEDDDTFERRLQTLRVAKVRFLGSVDDKLRLATIDAGLSVDDVPFVRHPRLEALHWVREQALSETRHRYGNITDRRPGPSTPRPLTPKRL